METKPHGTKWKPVGDMEVKAFIGLLLNDCLSKNDNEFLKILSTFSEYRVVKYYSICILVWSGHKAKQFYYTDVRNKSEIITDYNKIKVSADTADS